MTIPTKVLFFSCGFIAGALCAWDVPAKAQGASRYYTVRVCAWRYWDGSCHYTYHRRYRRAEGYHAPSRVYSWHRRGPQCEEIVSVTGEEKYGTSRAREAADAAWAERTRFLFGVRYMDLKNAKHQAYECGRSSTGRRASEAAAGAVGQVLEQCELRATPCRAERDGGER